MDLDVKQESGDDQAAAALTSELPEPAKPTT